MTYIGNDWVDILRDTFNGRSFKEIADFLKIAYAETTVYPPKSKVFNAFKLTPYADVKVVVLGQDPYHEVGQAEGLCFSVPSGVRVPPSLVNIKKAVETDLGVKMPATGSLEGWARQGVFLLNASLTVEEARPLSHQTVWQGFTDDVIRTLAKKDAPLVFMLWGASAKAKLPLIVNRSHLVLTACHPSPLAAAKGDFLTCKHFSKANDYLIKHGAEPIRWEKL